MAHQALCFMFCLMYCTHVAPPPPLYIIRLLLAHPPNCIPIQTFCSPNLYFPDFVPSSFFSPSTLPGHSPAVFYCMYIAMLTCNPVPRFDPVLSITPLSLIVYPCLNIDVVPPLCKHASRQLVVVSPASCILV